MSGPVRPRFRPSETPAVNLPPGNRIATAHGNARDDTGSRFLHLSPGLSVALNKTVQLYGFVQLPLHQRVNGVQLTSGWSVMAGVSARF